MKKPQLFLHYSVAACLICQSKARTLPPKVWSHKVRRLFLVGTQTYGLSVLPRFSSVHISVAETSHFQVFGIQLQPRGFLHHVDLLLYEGPLKKSLVLNVARIFLVRFVLYLPTFQRLARS
ncbi:hypothetical protein F5Y16DRAFT_376094 [Xylariaceae sp. FL0255]|nr:hypothetical protein F5Y16DRAFT_376094 [Xylariaceae sp. FL0255]